MNESQKKIIVAAIAAISGMLIYPPFEFIGRGGARASAGYDWLFEDYASVNVELLLTQWVGVIIVAAALHFVLKD